MAPGVDTTTRYTVPAVVAKVSALLASAPGAVPAGYDAVTSAPICVPLGSNTCSRTVSGSVLFTDTAYAVIVIDEPPACANQCCEPRPVVFITTGVQMHAPAGLGNGWLNGGADGGLTVCESVALPFRTWPG